VNDVWVCATCRSINRQRDSRCYRCNGPREAALGLPGAAPRLEAAVANRAVRPYTPTWPLAAISGTLILMASVLGIVILVQQALGFGEVKAAFIDSINGQLRGAEPTILAVTNRTAILSLFRLGLSLLALVTFAAWLAMATANVPALGGGEPSRSPTRVFVYTVIPLWQLIKVPGMIQDVLYRVDAQAGGFGMVIAAWIGLVGSRIVSFVGGWFITAVGVPKVLDAPTLRDASDVFAGMLDQSFVLGIVTEVMVAVGAVILVMLMARIERRCAIRDREIKAAAATSSPAVSPIDPTIEV
jgi:uncharacterized protein DUF4328